MFKNYKIINFFKQILFALLFTGVAVLIRVIFFRDLGRGIPYLTFYPVVALVALFGTFISGTVTVVLSFLLTYLWVQQGQLTSAEILAEVIFIISGLIISFVGEAKNRSQIKIKKLAGDLEKFKLAVDNVSDHIVITDIEGTVIYVNKMVEKVTGYTPSEVLGKKAGILWHLPMPKEFYKKFWDTIKNKKQTFKGILQNKRKNGEVYDAAVSISPVLDKNKNILYFVGIERDITKEKEIDRAKTEFVSLASHQLRTPLSTINWYVEILLGDKLGKLKSEQRSYLQEVYHSSKQMVELVNALLNVSRLELGTFIVEPELADITKIADQVIDQLSHKILEKQQVFEKKYDKNIKSMLFDEKLISMVLQNLFTNAIKYTPEKGKIKFEIKIKNKMLEILVADNGIGIPESQQDKIFTKLFRADNVRVASTEGTGLGLYIVKSIIDHSGGKIWFESKENKGTTFYINFPLSGMKKKEGDKQLN